MNNDLYRKISRRPLKRHWREVLYRCLLYGLLLLLLAGCQDEPPPLTPTLEPTPPPVTQQAELETLTPAAAATSLPTPVPTVPVEENGTLILWHSWVGADAEALARMLGSFQAANPNITVETLFVSYSRLFQAYVNAVYAGGGPDIILAPNWWLQQMADAETLLPLDGMVDAAVLESYLPAALDNMRYDGHLYGLPTNFDLVALYYNRTLIERGELPTTTAQMLALAQSDPRLGVGLYASFYHLYWGIPAYGSTLFNDQGQVILNQNSGTADFLAWLEEMNNTPGVFVDLDYGMLIDRFKKGEYAFFVDGPWSLEELHLSMGDDLAVALLPAGPAGPAQPWLSADGVFLSPVFSPQQQAMALRLAQHLTNAESGTFLVELSNRIPARSDVQIDDPLLPGFIAQATTAVPSPQRPELIEVWGYAGDMIAKVLNDVLSPREAVLEAETLINEANDR